MSADFPSSNPFRRKTPSSVPPPPSPPASHHIAYQQVSQTSSPTLTAIDTTHRKISKKVRVQSPPPPSPSKSDSPSTVGEDAYSISDKPPTPVPRDTDPFNAASIDISEDEERSRPQRAPPNPFSKTLETLENPDREPAVAVPTNNINAGRASMDVEAFKRLLMTGIGGPNMPTTQAPSQAHIAHALGDGGSSTDTSSLSRQSIFESIQEPHPESPRTSHEVSEPEDEPRWYATEPQSYTPGRKKPPPPSSKHGKLIRVELRDDPPNNFHLPTAPMSAASQQYLTSSPQSSSEPSRSQTDLNKPLPPAPSRRSHDSDRESIFDKEALGKTPEPPSPSPSVSVRRKIAPPPPPNRRHSQLVSESKLTRSNSGRLSPKAEEEYTPLALGEDAINRSRSNSNNNNNKAPPPPPSRRQGSIRMSSSSSHHHHHQPQAQAPTQQTQLVTSPSSISLPAPFPPLARGSSRSSRPPSVMSMDLSSTPNKRSSMIAPPPPPHRHGRTSMEGPASPSNDTSRRQSGEYSARQSMDGTRRDSVMSSLHHEYGDMGRERDNPGSGGNGGASRADVLADLTKLQREIDELRIQSEKEKKGERGKGA